jgi:hypothetical protein
MIAAGHEDGDDVQRRRPYEPTILREPWRLARVGPYRARWDRSLLPELRAAAAAHHSRHGRHRRSQQELALLRGDSHYCAEPPRWCCREPCAATTPSASPGTIFARVETTPMGTDVRFIITNPRRARQGALREVFWPTREPDRRHGAPGPVPACSRWQANQLPAHRHLLAAARGTEVFAPAGATFEMIRRTLVKIAVRVAPMIDAARAAASPHFNHKTRSDCRRGVPRAAHDLRRWLADAEADCVGPEARRGSRGYRSHP